MIGFFAFLNFTLLLFCTHSNTREVISVFVREGKGGGIWPPPLPNFQRRSFIV